MSTINIVNGNILDIKVDAIVNSSNTKLSPNSGVNKAIFQAAGSEKLLEHLKNAPKCEIGSAVLTPAFDLSNDKYIVHAVGPDYKAAGDKGIDLLYKTYISALETAAKTYDVNSIALPLIGSGISGFPKNISWIIGIKACRDFIARNLNRDYIIYFLNMNQGVVLMGKKILEWFEATCPTAIPNEIMMLESVDRGVLHNAIAALTKYNTLDDEIADCNIKTQMMVHSTIDKRIVKGLFILGEDTSYGEKIEDFKNVPCTEQDAFQIRSMLTFIKQGEKFCDGHIYRYIQDKSLAKLFLRIDDLIKKNKIEELQAIIDRFTNNKE